MTQQYVCGFMFQAYHSHVVLIRKNKPEWQKGKLNGVGGKVELAQFTIGADGKGTALESPSLAMTREFLEETGCKTSPSDWTLFRTEMFSNGAVVHFLSASVEPLVVQSMTDEEVGFYSVDDILRRGPGPFLTEPSLRSQLMYNLPYLIEMAIALYHTAPAARPLP